MSRAYRIKVSETVRKVIRAEDHISSQLEVLDVLPSDQMADLLAEELVKQGFERDGDQVVRTECETTVSVDLKTGTVTVKAEKDREVTAKGEKSGNAYDDYGPGRKESKKKLKEDPAKELEGEVSQRQETLQRQVTDKLESQLADLRKELDQAVNRATAEALKQKAAKLGQIKELTEDPETGSLTIVVEV